MTGDAQECPSMGSTRMYECGKAPSVEMPDADYVTVNLNPALSTGA